MNLFPGGLFRKKHAYRSRQNGGTPFTPAFYRFLLGFSLILALSFATLAFLGFTSNNQLTVSAVPGCDTSDTGTTGPNPNTSSETAKC